ncbi:ArsR/SmtB family transcription factor [Thalassospira alkalitolerans]|uniref:ArsR family transcriptional regulator n=1 Tax=Thalassospira alkalitolerans TaxID=1293890 RepID=A0A1Y2L6C3_9PROT|nr:ArsR family transcriptional regulator [Thalassospira alkalitolerans]OSQ43832.1 ArsR family transcriptional regulator [Thalassospira alkalitolerans]
MQTKLLTVDPVKDSDIVHGLASKTRIDILYLLRKNGPQNVNEIAEKMGLPQSTVAINIKTLEKVGLVETQTMKAKKGNQKICSAAYGEIYIRFDDDKTSSDDDRVVVSMPIGLFTEFDVGAPCGMCSVERIIGVLDVPNVFLDPQRMQATLLWFTRGYVEYKFPNNAKVTGRQPKRLEITAEVSSETPETNAEWPSDISIWINGFNVGIWTSPGDFGDRRGLYSPGWWKLAGSQYGQLKTWVIDEKGTWIDGLRISDQTIHTLGIMDHHSIRFRIGIDDNAKNPGGLNIFGREFGDHDQDITMTLCF